MKRYNIAVVGVGAVGLELLRCLKKKSNLAINQLRVFARTTRKLKVDRQTYNVKAISPKGFDGIDIALFAGTEGEKGAAVIYAPEAIKRGAVVIDNGADFRLKPDIPLIVPEVNPEDIKKHKGLIANPNCSTIQMVVALWPIYKTAGIKRIIVTSFQAASGAGRGALKQLWQETEEVLATGYKRQPTAKATKVLPQQIGFNVFPHIGDFQKYAYTSEEWKMVYETHKIMHDKNIKITATCARVPVGTGHSQAIYIETKKQISPQKAKQILSRAKGIKVIDQPENNLYPMPIKCEGKDEVFVGRIRSDPFLKCGLWLWVVCDNLIKGAALNAIQIAGLYAAQH
ncbi:MAG: aspartate-semialdehyde dehydrogenase [Candidatus Omnitrophica bacterium]|nr:aspartate-semialdehyde dehydrogenase [Candidatus Omnitrophota bacterium]